MQLVYCLVIVLLAGCMADDVVVLNSKNFESEVLKSNLPYLVEFYAPWCGHCKNLEPAWRKAATQLKDLIPVGKVDATVEGNLAGQYGVKGYPTIKLFVKGESKPRDYNGARDAKSIMNFALNSLPNRVHVISTADKLPAFWSKQESLPHAVLFTSKSKTSHTFKSLAARFIDKIVFAEIREGSSVADSFENIEQYPELRVYTSKDAEPQKHEGAMKPAALVEFLAGFAGDEAVPEKPAKKAAAAVEIKGETIIDVKDEAEFEDKCGKLCVVGIYEAGSDDEAVMTSARAKFMADQKFEFLHMEPEAGKELGAKCGVPEAPGLFVFKSKRKRFAAVSSFEASAVQSLLERVLGGDAKFSKME